MAAKTKKKTKRKQAKKPKKVKAKKVKSKAPTLPKGRGGPRLRLTPERMNRIIAYKRIGAPDVVAYQMASVGERTFYTWKAKGQQVLDALSPAGHDAWENIAMAAADLLHMTFKEQVEAELIPADAQEPLTWGQARVVAIEILGDDALIYFEELTDAAKVIGVPAFHADIFVQFVAGLRRAESENELEAISTIRFNITAKKNWVAAMTFLERRYPERWRRRSDVHVDPEKTEGQDHTEGRKLAQAILHSKEATALHNQALIAAGHAQVARIASRSGDEGN